ncbi:stage II sporulation protein P [Paenibacillus sp. J5C_2022]|uniref:stage II sporulation protein P n=1 Tax=Paenibacillus sp. J5C2022 TaxID=2977129 RepID=UPI0021CFDDAE|nr:stage II sporulation protein P [Paenibacillus sp. J5C2022]MCU6707645.1 stage II sporulation protein P [Paenibacillus sp. J5C2022]
MWKQSAVQIKGLEWNGGRKLKELLMTGKAFAVLSLCSMLFFILLGVVGMIYEKSSQSAMHSMKGLAASVSSGLLGDMLEMEVPSFRSDLPSEAFSGKDVGIFLMRSLTDVNPAEPRSMLAGELPGMKGNDAFLIRKGSGTDTTVGPQDRAPIAYNPLEGLEEENGTELVVGEDGVVDDQSTTGNDAEDAVAEPSGKPTTGRQIAFIYHSHNRESWYPELDGEAKDPSSRTKNITLVGKRLADKLEENGIGTMVSDVDYPTAIDDYRWELSYKYSKKTVKEALASNDDLQFLFDLHRDSQKRKYTTVDIDGTSYAQVYFVIGHKNPEWEKNEAFATKIHEALEAKYPGISRGIWGKTAATGNGEYNQSLASESVLIEIGGVDNTLEESYRTADALAKVVADIYWEDAKVSGGEGSRDEAK